MFTLESIGIALCETYKQSKGKSLSEAKEDDTIKLLKDLLDYYEEHYKYEIENDEYYSKLYKRCKDIMESILYNKSPLASVAVELKEKFSSEYLSSQIDLNVKNAV